MRHPSGRAFSAFFAWVLAAVPVFAAGPAAPPNPVAPGPGEFTGAQQTVVDDAISRARSLVEELEGLASGGLDGSNCPKTVGVQDISADYKAHKFSKGIEGEVHRLISTDPDHWEMANTCLAYARKDPAICD
ncbi:MAG: hypothetical protein KGL74_08820, partial [Elusimicrobia bacterium]|nr:hypothetical protein [Elusimicrobiota bacterium]